MEIALEPISNSQFIQKLEESTEQLGMQNLFSEYLAITELNKVDDASVEDKLKLFKVIWDETSFTAKQNLQAFESSHFKNKTKLRFYLNPAFLQGMVARTKSLINSGKAIEATHYLNDVLVDLIENYAWLKSSVDKVKIDYTTLMRSLKGLEKKNPKNYEHMIELLSLSDVDKTKAADTIEKTRKIMVNIRRKRKVLIKNHLLKS